MTHFTILINITVKCPKRVHIPQRVKSFKNVLLFVELAQELTQSHLQYTDDPLHNTSHEAQYSQYGQYRIDEYRIGLKFSEK